MRLLRLGQDQPIARAALPGSAAVKIPHASIGDAHQPLVMAMQVISVTHEAGVDRVDTTHRVAQQVNAIGGWFIHDTPRTMLVPLVQRPYRRPTWQSSNRDPRWSHDSCNTPTNRLSIPQHKPFSFLLPLLPSLSK